MLDSKKKRKVKGCRETELTYSIAIVSVVVRSASSIEKPRSFEKKKDAQIEKKTETLGTSAGPNLLERRRTGKNALQ